MIKYGDLVNQCVSCIKSYNKVTHTIDGHCDEFVSKENIDDENEQVFIKQVFYGQDRYSEFLSVDCQAFTTKLFQMMPSSRQDIHIYNIFAYLTVFRFDELSYDEYKKLVMSQNPVVMNNLLNFLFDTERLTQVLRDDWITIYDPEYIDNYVIGGLQNKLSQISDLMDQISQKATGKKSELNTMNKTATDKDEDKNKRKTTQIKSFNLTKPKPKALPEPIKIPKIVQSNPIPKTTYDRSYKDVEEQKKKRQEQIKEETKAKYEQSKLQKFKLLTEQAHAIKKFESFKKEQETLQENAIQFVPTFFKEIPKFSEPAEIKMNVAAILREEKYLQIAKQEKQKVIDDFEKNQRDDTEFQNWKMKNDDKDKIAELERLQKKKIEMELSREQAIRAYQEKIDQNHKLAQQLKEDTEKKLQERELKIIEEVKEKQALIEGVLATKDNAEIEKQKIIQKNKQTHDKTKKEIQQLLDKRKEEDQIELRKKEELIRQIRELESKPIAKQKGYDPTETSGLGLLEEMSLVELRERIVIVKKEQEEKRIQIKVKNAQKKDEKLVQLQSKISAISEERALKAKINVEKRQEKKKQEAEEIQRKKEIYEKQLLEVHQKVKDKKHEKRMEEIKLAKELKEINLRKQYLNANQAMVEAKAWQCLEQGAEREIQDRQNIKLFDNEKLESIRYKERKILAKSAQMLVADKVEFLLQQQEQSVKANKENEILIRQLREEKKQKYTKVKEYEYAHTQNLEERNHFSTKINELSLQQAKSIQSTRSIQKNNQSAKNIDTSKLPPSKFNDDQHIQIIQQDN